MYITYNLGQNEGTPWREVRVIALAHKSQHELACQNRERQSNYIKVRASTKVMSFLLPLQAGKLKDYAA